MRRPTGFTRIGADAPDRRRRCAPQPDLRTTSDSTTLDGSIIRVDATTGSGLPDNPLAASADANARRIIAYGLRNPFRFTFRPGTSELWIGDVGWNEWEEINKVLNPTNAVVENFGWPCYEGIHASRVTTPPT